MQTCNGKCQWPARNQQLFILYPEGFVSQHPPDGLSTGIQPHLLQSIMSQCFYATAGCLCLDGLSFPQKTKSSCFAIIYFFEQDCSIHCGYGGHTPRSTDFFFISKFNPKIFQTFPVKVHHLGLFHDINIC